MSSVYIADPDEENTKRVQQYFAIHGYSTEGFSALLRSGRKHSSPVQCWSLNSSKLVIDRGSHVARLDGREIHFTASEWKVLTFLAFRAGSLVSRMQLLQLCFPESLESYDRVIDTHVKNIRAKLGATGSEWIETVRGYGYRFRGTPEIL